MSADEEEGEIKGASVEAERSGGGTWGAHLVSGLVRGDRDILSSDEKGRMDETPSVGVSHLRGRMVRRGNIWQCYLGKSTPPAYQATSFYLSF